MFGHRNRGFRFGCGQAGGHGFQRFHQRWGNDENWGGWPFGRHSGGRGGGRRFGRGDLKYVILDLLKEQPRHGYDIIRALEDRFHGFYSPSPGSVYPTLQLLEDQGYVTSTEQDGKRIYTITDEGTKFLAEREDVMEGVRSRMRGEWGANASPEVRQLVQEVAQIGQLLFRQGARGALHDPEKVRRLRDVVARTRAEIESIFNDSATSSQTVV
jgi:DNA-binding PadR family transcriptional regulator